MVSIPVHIENRDAGSQKGRLVAFGCPVPKGLMVSIDGLTIKDADLNLPFSAEVTARWPDNSIKWLHIETLVDIAANESKTLSVSTEMESPANEVETSREDRFQACDVIARTDDTIVVSHFGAKYSFSRSGEQFALDIESGAGNIRMTAPVVRSQKGVIIPFAPAEFRVLEGQGPGRHILVEVSGHFKAEGLRRDIAATIAFTFLPFSPLVKGRLTLHNPNAAKHLNGLWDLGDPGSFLFSSCDFGIEYPGETASYRLDAQAPWQQASDRLSIYQGGSGGEQWDSPVHVNADNKVAVNQRGYTVNLQAEAEITSGLRSSPAVFIEGREAGGKGLFFKPHQFWQNFPKSISVSKGEVMFGVFPAGSSEPYELQGGEKKSHQFYFSASASSDQFDWLYQEITIAVDPKWITTCGVVPGLNEIKELEGLDALIDIGISHPQHSFFHKRERIDEYGWRNFGDLYADHETAEYKGSDLFVSHYNNQYDPIYGMLRQYLATGKEDWLQLADDLARHVSDIDVYDTEDDKFEYNGGLFWHTDHYVDAQTSTHRTYSARQQKGVYQDHAGGGGPGGQHCYTTGLMYHHFLTGSEASRKAVLQLTEWITHVYEGNRGVLEYLLALKNARNPGLKNPLTRKYPLDRGTGNYLVALLDSYQLTLDSRFLQRSAQVIRNTVNPAEDISLRNLHNVEETWFYTIFFQAVVKFLLVKQDADQLDDDFYYARDSLIHFAGWMVENEYPYLEKPEILEFPNHTWVAQDVRKAYLLTYAAMFCPDREKRRQMQKKAKFFENYVVDCLKAEETNYYTRILAILMQNHGFSGLLSVIDEGDNWQEILGIKPEVTTTPIRPYPVPIAAGAAVQWLAAGGELMRRLVQLSLKRELDWLSKRSEKVAGWVNR
ncbi:hypothetical protein BTA51_10480 [Hahella sp. CCB-MM4]|uniref:RIFT barrel domain-containing protein n=1 Tax=Hahella sp. (strain CCB-MM4) TaxID=1926491 RepID=UPI000B9A7E57|nr:hypothetical protein [Hahella sp. CCB-MM4]OZG73437.1 hypothetical protein BTA51_10480 [Hahella sp. CCB-MM4]